MKVVVEVCWWAGTPSIRSMMGKFMVASGARRDEGTRVRLNPRVHGCKSRSHQLPYISQKRLC